MSPPPTIDVQTHYVPPDALRLLQKHKAKGGAWHGLAPAPNPRPPICGLDARLRAMDEVGVAVSVLSFAPLGPLADAGFAAELCDAANDGLIEACTRHPDRFVAAAVLPLPRAETSLRALQRIGSEPCVRAVHIVADTLLYRPDDESFSPIFAEAAGLGLPVLLHPTAGAADLAPEFDAFGLGSGMHAMVSHALVAARMIGSGLMDRLPGLELILTHLGGILPFLIERLDSRHRGDTAHLPSHYLRDRIAVDCCGYPAGPALRCALETVGHERLLVGSDWPSRSIAPALQAITGLGLPHAEEEAILGGNARRWFDPLNSRASDSRRH